VDICACLYEGPIEIVTVIGCENGRLGFDDVGEKFSQQCPLVLFVENFELSTIVVFSGGVLEVSHVIADDLAVGYQVTRAVNDITYHHDLVELNIWEFQGLLRSLNIKSHDSEVSLIKHIFQ